METSNQCDMKRSPKRYPANAARATAMYYIMLYKTVQPTPKCTDYSIERNTYRKLFPDITYQILG